ncbi:MAG: mechanosensitive ion channel family protein [Myxococcales bacterium]|nr:MAG: mechanosensitive ion channel family protein [Myxococcales bacterium]
MTLKTVAGEQWGVGREMRERIKDRFDAEGIVMPHPYQGMTMRPAPEAGE